MRILTGEEPEDYGDTFAKNQAAAEQAAKVGRCAESMTPERRAEIAKKAAARSWEE
jgi:hypothetical protein